MNASKAVAVLVAGLVAFALFGLAFSATSEDGVLPATSVGILLGLAGFLGVVLVARILSDMGK